MKFHKQVVEGSNSIFSLTHLLLLLWTHPVIRFRFFLPCSVGSSYSSREWMDQKQDNVLNFLPLLVHEQGCRQRPSLFWQTAVSPQICIHNDFRPQISIAFPASEAMEKFPFISQNQFIGWSSKAEENAESLLYLRFQDGVRSRCVSPLPPFSKLLPNLLWYILNDTDDVAEMAVMSRHFIQHGWVASSSETGVPKPHLSSFLKVNHCTLHFTSTPQCQALLSLHISHTSFPGKWNTGLPFFSRARRTLWDA